jgi:hypothetical protein
MFTWTFGGFTREHAVASDIFYGNIMPLHKMFR